MGGQSIMALLGGMIMIFGTVTVNIIGASNRVSENFTRTYNGQTARNIAQSGVNMGLRQLASNKSWRTGYSLMNLMGGKVRVRLADTLFSGDSAVAVIGTGIVAFATTQESTATCYAFYPKVLNIPFPVTVKAAVTANTPVSTLGNLTVDGRDHDLNGVLIASTGLSGIWSTKANSQSGNSKIGGTSGSTDYAPAKPGNAATIKANQIWPGGYPGTPDSVLGGPSFGLTEGTLKALAQSGVGGSQFSTSGISLTTPLKGVTYVELPSGGVWQPSSIAGSGVLIVHNSAKNAIIKNLNSGTFKGIIVADDIVHVHADIYGAIIGLSPNPSEGNCLGNGNGNILFSRQAIQLALAGLSPFGSSQANVLGWWE